VSVQNLDASHGMMIRFTVHNDIAVFPSGVASDAEPINLLLSGLLLVKYDCVYGSCRGTSAS
jgi:hypothetical protein